MIFVTSGFYLKDIEHNVQKFGMAVQERSQYIKNCRCMSMSFSIPSLVVFYFQRTCSQAYRLQLLSTFLRMGQSVTGFRRAPSVPADHVVFANDLKQGHSSYSFSIRIINTNDHLRPQRTGYELLIVNLNQEQEQQESCLCSCSEVL